MKFDGKVVVITGAAAGIGRATALAFAELGASVAAVDVDAGGKDVAESIKKRGGRAIFCRTDISRDGAVRQMMEKIKQQMGGVDVLVNNAAIAREGSVLNVSVNDWQEVLNTNLTGAFLCSKYCVPYMESRGGGAIINVASVQGLATEQDNAAYSASKGGLIALTKSMALDFAPKNIRVNCVCPGAIASEKVERAISEYPDPEKAYREWSDLHALKRLGKPEEVANVIVFLASGLSSFVTGTPVLVDGGMLAAFGTAGKPV